jgi:hypothetical protein
MPNVTISEFPTRGTVLDTTVFATETSGATEKITAASLKNYVSSLTSVVTTGVINAAGGLVASSLSAGIIGNVGTVLIGTVSTAAQPNITTVGTLTGLTVTGNITLNGSQVWSAASDASFGSINSTPIGNQTPSTAAFTSVVSTGLVVNGTMSASTGQFTTINGTNINLSGSVTPTANLLPKLGSVTRWFGQAFVNTASIRTGSINTVNAVTVTASTVSAASIATTNIAATTFTASTSVIPNANVSSSLGNSTRWFSQAFVNTASIRTGNINTVNAVTVTASTMSAPVITGTTLTTSTVAAATVTASTAINPTANLSVGLGTNTLRFNNIYGGTGHFNTLNTPVINSTTMTGTTMTVTNLNSTNLVVSANFEPLGNVSVNLGSTSKWFNVIYGKAIQAQYADLAEIYQADAVYDAGTVVAFGGDAEITVSDQSHDPAVAGVISTAPAYLMNSAATGLPVALSGRVPCKVQGPVRKGQRLVNAGHGLAMALDPAQYQPGCVIGHSLVDHPDSDIRIIEVVIMKF